MTTLVLASGSPTRRRLLAAAGLDFDVDTAPIDETQALLELRGDGAPAPEAARALARRKAQAVSRRRPAALVIGADQILEHRGAWLEKPADRTAARAQLAALRGGTHRLVSGVAVLRDGALLWDHADAAEMAMRGFDDAWLDRYLDAAGPAVLGCVGVYQLEGLGVQLFESVRGDFFTVLGLPLLPLLAFLRSQGVAAP